MGGSGTKNYGDCDYPYYNNTHLEHKSLPAVDVEYTGPFCYEGPMNNCSFVVSAQMTNTKHGYFP